MWFERQDQVIRFWSQRSYVSRALNKARGVDPLPTCQPC